MRYLVQLVLVLAILAGITVIAYAYFGDMTARQEPQDLPVSLPQE